MNGVGGNARNYETAMAENTHLLLIRLLALWGLIIF